MKENKWHRKVTREHICIWSDEWMENAMKNRHRERTNPEDVSSKIYTRSDDGVYEKLEPCICDVPNLAEMPRECQK